MPIYGCIRQMSDGMVSAESSLMPPELPYMPKVLTYIPVLHHMTQTARTLLVHKKFFCTTLVSLVPFKLHRHRIGVFLGLRAWI